MMVSFFPFLAKFSQLGDFFLAFKKHPENIFRDFFGLSRNINK
jgi:hypothetical protein